MSSRGRSISLALLTAVILTVGLGACASVDRATVEQQLLALPKNAPVRAVGLQTREADIVLSGEPARVEFSYLEVSAANPALSNSDARRTVVLVHGTPSSLFTWSEVVFGGDEFEGLAQHYDVYALDVIGHGITRSASSSYSFATCAEYVAGFLESLDLREVCLVGQSYGGEFAWRAALAVPERVDRLVLIDSAGYPRESDGFLSEEVAMREMWLAPYGYFLNSRERIASALDPHFSEPLAQDRVDEIFWVCENAGNWKAMVDLVRDENGLGAHEIQKISAPTLLIWGDRDLAYPAERDGAFFARDLPDARLRVVDDCGHYPQEERPAAVVAVVREFLEVSEE